MEINFMQVLFQAVNFGVIFFVLTKFLYKPIQKILNDRAIKINDGLKAAEKNLKAESDLEVTKKKELTKVRKEASKIISDAKLDAKEQVSNILKKARAEAKAEAKLILESASSNAKAQEKKTASALKELTIATTRKLLSDTLSAKEVKTITNNMVKNLK
ncbi:MAG: hypothetical protein DRN14_04255 [Thermoplasmata archaeon]|nr:MAG: hypothetical protein DRN14_04255 [Thermoplasmata archaeon]